MKRFNFLFALFTVSVLVLNACQMAPSVPTGSEAPQPQTLVVWDQFHRDVEGKVMDTLNAEFEAAHPGVKIERVVKVLDDLKITLPLAFTQADGPDVAQVNQGRNDMGSMVEGGLLLPLNKYVTQFNWGKVVSSSVAKRNSFTTDGKTFGQGEVFGVSPTAEVVGVYYNKSMFKEHGWDVPTTFEDFEALLAEIKAAGITPISFGSLDGWPAIHEYSAIQHLLVSMEYIDNFVYGINNASFDIPENKQAAEILLDWVKAGYFSDGFAGIGYDDGNLLFKSGKGAMTITGSWLAGELLAGTDQEFGFFLLPPYSGKSALAIGGVGIPFSIRATTTKADLAAEYLDWMISPRAAELWAESGMVPAIELPADSRVDMSGLFGDTMRAWNEINKNNVVGHYIDWATPTFYDASVAELQKLLGELTTPAEFTAALDKVYQDYLATIK